MSQYATCKYAPSGCNFPEGECTGQCLADKWTMWAGSATLPEAPDVLVEYKMRNGLTVGTGAAVGSLRWTHEGSGGDIVAYRIKK